MKSLRIGDLVLKVSQRTDTGDFDGFLWPCGVVLAHFIYYQRPLFAEAATCVEIGSGIALPSLTLAASFPETPTVIATDKSENALSNIAAQAIASKISNLQAHQWRWDDDTSPLTIDISQIDVLLAADVLYQSSDFHPVMALIAKVLHGSRRPNCFCLLAYHERSSRRSIEWFLDHYQLIATLLHHDYESNPCVWLPDLDNLQLNGISDVFLYKIELKCVKRDGI